MIPQYADAFAMTNFQRLRDSGVWFKQAMLGYMCSETVVSHNVVVSGKLPRNMGWTDAVLRDANNLLGFGVDSLHLTGDLSLANFSALIKYPKLADYVHTQFPGSSFIVVGEKSYAVDAAAPSADIAAAMSARTNAGEPCEAALGGRYRFPAGKNVPAYISEPACGRFFVNCESDLGTAASFPSWLYPSDGGHFSPGSDPAHLGGDTWVADAALAMDKEPWRGMYVTMGAIDKAAHQFGASFDIATPVDCKNNASDQVHVRCAAELADVQLGRLLDKVAEQDERDGTETRRAHRRPRRHGGAQLLRLARQQQRLHQLDLRAQGHFHCGPVCQGHAQQAVAGARAARRPQQRCRQLSIDCDPGVSHRSLHCQGRRGREGGAHHAGRHRRLHARAGQRRLQAAHRAQRHHDAHRDGDGVVERFEMKGDF
jgi:hypothetical protein